MSADEEEILSQSIAAGSRPGSRDLSGDPLSATSAKPSREVNKMPVHVAMIMDGNGRWAVGRGLNRVEGHRAGVDTVRMVVAESRRAGVRYLTLYAFSTENWQRLKQEVAALMNFFEHYLGAEAEKL